MNLENYPHTWMVVTAIAVLFGIRLAVGYWASRKVSDAADYIVAGRRLPLYIAAASIMATWFAGEALMGSAATAYRLGFHGVVFDPFGATLCLLISGLFFIRLMRRARYLTVVDFFQRRYGWEMNLLASLSQLATYFGWTAAQFVAGGLILHGLFPSLPLPVAMAMVGVIVTVYTTMGGMWADTLLDFIQMFLTAAGITVVFVFTLNAVGGWQGMIADAAAQNNAHPFTLLPVPGEGYLGYQGALGFMYWLAAWMSLGLGSIACQDLMQRSMSARDEATSVWGSYVAAILYFTFGVMSPLVGIMMFKLHPGLGETQVQEVLVLAVMQEYVPPVIAALFIAALSSALMSTSDSSILAGASVVTENILPLLRPNLSDRAILLWTRIMVVVVGSASLAIAWAIADVYRLATISWSVLLVGLFPPFALGMYWKKANRAGAVVAFLAGFVTWVSGIFYFYPTTRQVNTVDGVLSFKDAVWDAVYISTTPAVAVCLILVVVVSLLTQRRDPPLPLTDVDGNPLELKNRLGLIWRSKSAGPAE